MARVQATEGNGGVAAPQAPAQQALPGSGNVAGGASGVVGVDSTMTPLTPMAPIMGTALRPDRPQDPNAVYPAPHKKYVVTRGGVATVGGARTTIREGKVIDGVNYSLAQLRMQGLKFEELKEDDAT